MQNTKVPPPGVYSKWQQVNVHHLTFPAAGSTVRGCEQVKQLVVHINSDSGETRRKGCGFAAQLLVVLLHLGPVSYFTCMLPLIFHSVARDATVALSHAALDLFIYERIVTFRRKL